MPPISISPADLISAGFSEVTYEQNGNDPGVFFQRKTLLKGMLILSREINGFDVFADDIVITEICPDGRIQFVIGTGGNHYESGIEALFPKGQEILKDCLDAPIHKDVEIPTPGESQAGA